jgi:hypothetical protein
VIWVSGIKEKKQKFKLGSTSKMQKQKLNQESLRYFLMLLDICSFPYTSSRDFFFFFFLGGGGFQLIVNVIFALNMQAS